jgi:hypothetical protein
VYKAGYMPVKTHHTAVVAIPPPEVWSPIQAIRRQHDRNVQRWMPHITLIYPFMPRKHCGEALPRLLDDGASIHSDEQPQFALWGHSRPPQSGTRSRRWPASAALILPLCTSHHTAYHLSGAVPPPRPATAAPGWGRPRPSVPWRRGPGRPPSRPARGPCAPRPPVCHGRSSRGFPGSSPDKKSRGTDATGHRGDGPWPVGGPALASPGSHRAKGDKRAARGRSHAGAGGARVSAQAAPQGGGLRRRPRLLTQGTMGLFRQAVTGVGCVGAGPPALGWPGDGGQAWRGPGAVPHDAEPDQCQQNELVVKKRCAPGLAPSKAWWRGAVYRI